MGVPQSPSATPTFPATITPPADGDALSATTLNTNVETPLQNGVEAARLLTYAGGIRRNVICTSSTVMVIQPTRAVVATVSSAWTVVPWTTGAATIDPTALAGGALAASTRYWVYATAVLSAGVPVFVVSTNAPNAALGYSSATTDQMYVTTFYTDSTSAIIPYTQLNGQYLYQDINNNGNRVLSLGNATVQTTVNLGAETPTGANAVIVYATTDSTAAARKGYIYVTGGYNGFSLDDDGTNAPQGQGIIPLVNGRSFDYKVTNAAMHLSAWIVGFSYE